MAMENKVIFSLKVLAASMVLIFGTIIVAMQKNKLDEPGLFLSAADMAHLKSHDFMASTEDTVKIKILEKQLEVYNKLVEKIDGGKKTEPKKSGYMAVFSQEAKKMTETMIKITIWTATIPLVFVVCVTSAGAVLDILARLNAFHGAGEVFWSGASGAFANVMDGLTRGWFSTFLGLKNESVIVPVDPLALQELSSVAHNSGFFSSWFTVKNPENATLLTPYLG